MRPQVHPYNGKLMGRQVTFFLTPNDTDRLMAQLSLCSPFLILHSRSQLPTPKVVPSVNVREGDQDWLYFLLIRESDLEGVKLKEVSAQHYWSIDVLRSPVIEFNRCFFDGRILRRGRIWYETGFYGLNREWICKSADFITWAEKLLKTTRKCLTKDGSNLLGQGAKELVENGEGVLQA